MWHHTATAAIRSSPPSHHRNHPAAVGTAHMSQRGTAKATPKNKTDEWIPLRGWEGECDDEIQTIDIESWAKKHNISKRDTAKNTKAEWQIYLCWSNTHCSKISDYESFVRSSLMTPHLTTPPGSSLPVPTTTEPQSRQVKAKSTKSPQTKLISKVEHDQRTAKSGPTESKRMGEVRERSVDGENEAKYEGGKSLLGSECPPVFDRGDPGRIPTDRTTSTGGKVPPKRTNGATHSAPVSRVVEPEQVCRIASAKATCDGESSQATKVRRAAIRNSAAKFSMELRQLTIDLPPSPPTTRAFISANSPQDCEASVASSQLRENVSDTSQDVGSSGSNQDDTYPSSRTALDKAAVFRRVEETLKRGSGQLGFELPHSSSVSVGDLLSSSPRIVHRVGPSGDTDRDPNVCAALIGGISLPLGSWSPDKTSNIDGAMGPFPMRGLPDSLHHHLHPHPTIKNGSRTRDAVAGSVLPKVSSNKSPNSSLMVVASAPKLDSTPTGDSVMLRHSSTEDQTWTSPPDAAGLLKKTLQRAISRCDRDAVRLPLPRRKRRQHRGPPGFRAVAHKTPLQRAVETAHKKIHGQHYYLFTHGSNTTGFQQPFDWGNLPKTTESSQHSIMGHQERASTGPSHVSNKSAINAGGGYLLWKEHLETSGPTKQQTRITTAQSKHVTGENKQQTNPPRISQSSSTLTQSQIDEAKPDTRYSWEDVPTVRGLTIPHVCTEETVNQ